MAKKPNKRSKRYPVGFQRDAVERMKNCEDIGKLAEELGVSRGALYLWKRRGEGLPSYRDMAREGYQAPPDDERARTIRELETKVASLEGELGRRSLEASFFGSALRRVEAARRQNDKPGAMRSTTKSAAGRSRKAR
jgi:DNA-binding transcriptional MerR regulator